MRDESTPSPVVSQVEQRVCPQCGAALPPGSHPLKKFCSARCKWTYTNRTRTLKPNVFYDCVVCGRHVEKYLEPYNQARSALRYCSRTCKGIDMSGERHPMWNGGRIVERGYVFIHMPNHPYADRRGYVREHRLVMERVIGRYLAPEEVVHHENDDTQDNDPGNLILFATQAEHKAYEHAKRQRDDIGRYLPREKAS